MSAPSGGWFDDAFGAWYPLVYRHRSDAAAREEVAWLVDHLGLGPGVLALDAGCGAGRHSRAISGAGARVVGLDRSPALLATARQTGSGVAYVRGDLRALPFRSGVFHRVLSLFTSFGYFDDLGNQRQICELARVLAPHGRLLIDYLDADHVRRHLVAASERSVGDFLVRERRELVGQRVEKSVVVRDVDGDAVAGWRESVRLYDESELRACLAGAGLVTRDVFGELDGRPRGEATRRVVLVAEHA